MAMTVLDKADKDGFEQGWFDGLHGQPAIAKPALSPGLFDLEYLKRFKAAYLDGHATAQQEMARREELLLHQQRQRSQGNRSR